MDYPNLNVPNQMEESIIIQRVNEFLINNKEHPD